MTNTLVVGEEHTTTAIRDCFVGQEPNLAKMRKRIITS